jgi:hypothetical protein
MLILFIRKNKKGEQNIQPKNNKNYSKEHNEDMKKFRLAHRQEYSPASDILRIAGHVLATLKTTRLANHTQN